MFPTLTEQEFVAIKAGVAKLAEAWLNAPTAARHPDGRDDEIVEEARRARKAALRMQLDVLGIHNMGQARNVGQLQCLTRFLAENIALVPQ